MVRVVTHLGGKVEGGRQTGLTRGQEVVETLVGLLRASEAGVLTHRPQSPAVHLRVDAPSEGVVAGCSESLRQAFSDIIRAVKLMYLDAGIGSTFLVHQLMLALGASR
jgi:hypothetical protein